MKARPNVLFIMTDQLRWDAVGCAGGPLSTPNIDRLAENGVRFTNCVTNSPVCIPARISLATGLYPHNTNVWYNLKEHDMDPNQRTWMQAVRDAGYRTCVIGKTHLHRHSGDLRDREHLINAYGLDDVDEIAGPRASAKSRSNMTDLWDSHGKLDAYKADLLDRFSTKPYVARASVLGLDDYADVYVGQRACRYLEEYDRDQPWFCWVSFGGPHEPWDAPEPFASMYRPEDMAKPLTGELNLWQRPSGSLDRLLADEKHSPRSMTIDDIMAMRANYAGNVTLIDRQIGAILSVVEERGELEDTVVIFTADHGEMNGDYNLIYKYNFLNGALRVPLVITVPDADGRRNQICDGLVELMDIGPTVLDLVGATPEYPQFGRSLRDVLSGRTNTHRHSVLSEIYGEAMVMDDEWKMVVNGSGEAYLLFNRGDDPQEERNLAGAPHTREVITRLKALMLDLVLTSQLHGGVSAS